MKPWHFVTSPWRPHWLEITKCRPHCATYWVHGTKQLIKWYCFQRTKTQIAYLLLTCTPSAHRYVRSGVEHAAKHSARQCQAPPRPTAAGLCMDKWVRLRKTLFSILSLHILPYVLIPVYIMRRMPLRVHRMCIAAKLILLLEPQPLHFLSSCCLVQILLIFFFNSAFV